MRHKIKKTALLAARVGLCLIVLDLLILLAGLSQIITGEGSGHWNAFWRIQVEILLWLLS